jgi:hypothetical protein
MAILARYRQVLPHLFPKQRAVALGFVVDMKFGSSSAQRTLACGGFQGLLSLLPPVLRAPVGIVVGLVPGAAQEAQDAACVEAAGEGI